MVARVNALSFAARMSWAPITGFPGYEVSSEGRVRGPRGELSPWVVESSRDKLRTYLKVGLQRDGRRHRFFVHRLVAEAFCPRPEDATDVCHRNHTSTDNRAENLEWKTHAENVKDTYGEDAVERRALFEESLGVLSYAGPEPGLPF